MNDMADGKHKGTDMLREYEFTSTNPGGGLYLVHYQHTMGPRFYLGDVRKVGRHWVYRLVTKQEETETKCVTRKEATERLHAAYLAHRHNKSTDNRTAAQRYVDSRTPKRYQRAS